MIKVHYTKSDKTYSVNEKKREDKNVIMFTDKRKKWADKIKHYHSGILLFPLKDNFFNSRKMLQLKSLVRFQRKH